MIGLACFRFPDIAPAPTWVQYLCPLASRPWRREDMERLPDVPYLNQQGYVDFAPGDPEDPRNWGKARSWYISLGAIFLCLNGTIASSISSGCLEAIAMDFRVSQTAASLTTTLFLLGYCAGPFIFAPLSEFYGRRWVIYSTFLAYLAFTVLCAFAPNFGALLVGRFLSGTFVSASLCATPGILADLWNPLVRDNTLALFSVAVWAGPSLGPIIAAFLSKVHDWRWGFYFVLMYGAVAVLVMLTLPETHAPTILIEKARRHRQTRIPGFQDVQTESEAQDVSLKSVYKVALTRPWALLFDLISFLCAVYMAVVFMLQFMLFSIYPFVFEQVHGWNETVAQLPLLGAVVGSFIAAAAIALDTHRRKRRFQRIGYLEPEDHLFTAMFGSIGFPLAMFWFAWSGQYKEVHWIVPTLAGTVLSTSLMLIFVAFINYMVQAYGQYSASIVAVNTFARSLGSASAPLFTDYMFEAMGIGGGGSLIAGVATLLAVIPFLFVRYGRRIRLRSKHTEVAGPKAGEEHPTSYTGTEQQEEGLGATE